SETNGENGSVKSVQSVFRNPATVPLPVPRLLEQLLQVVHRFAVVLDGQGEVRLREGPRLAEVTVAQAERAFSVAFWSRFADVEVLDEVEFLQFVDVPVDGGQRRVAHRGE